MLILTRKQGQALVLTIRPECTDQLADLLRDGITIAIGEVKDGKVRVGIDAPDSVLVLRDELVGLEGALSLPNG